MNKPGVILKLEDFCDGCPYMDLNFSQSYADNRCSMVSITCLYRDECTYAVQSDMRSRPFWHSVEDELPAPGELVLCAMEKDGVWYPRWGAYTGESWKVIVNPYSRIELPIDRLSHWMSLMPPKPMPAPVAAHKGKTGLEKIREMEADELIETLTGKWVDICPPPFQQRGDCVKDISCSECWRKWLTEPEVRHD
mgnify:CR=1 FL=1